MITWNSRYTTGLIMAISIPLVSCGGGGGSSQSGYRISFDKSSISFDYLEGSPSPTETVHARDSGEPPDDGIYVGATVTGQGIEQPITIYIDESTDQAYAKVAPMAGLLPGTYTGDIMLMACADEICKRHFPGSPHTVHYSIHVHPRLKAQPFMVGFSAPEEQDSAPQTLQLTLPDGVSSITPGISYLRGNGWLQVQNNGNNLVLSARTAGLTPGTYNANLTLQTSTGGQQTVIVPVSLNVVYNAAIHLHADLNSVSFAAVETQALPVQTLKLNLPRASALTTSVTYASGEGNWLTVRNNSGNLELSANTTGLAPATYQATLKIADGAENLSVPVSLTIGKGLIPQTGETYSVTSDSTGTGSFAVQAAPGVANTSWTAGSDKPWLVIDNPSGDIGGELRWHLDPAIFGTLANNASHVASVTISGSGLSPITKQFTFAKQFTEIAHIDSLALLAGESGDVLLYGSGFAGLRNFAALVQMDGGPVPESVDVLSNTLARLKLPAVPAGEYNIRLGTAMGATTHSNILRVMERRNYSYQTIPTSWNKGSIVWDPVSQAAFTLSSGKLHRFGWNGSQFVGSEIFVEHPGKLAMDRDYQSVVIATTDGKVKRMDPVTLEERSSKTGYYSTGGYQSTVPLAIDGANRIWTGTMGYGLDNDTKIYMEYGRGIAFSSPNGRRLLFSDSGYISSTPPPVGMDLLNGNFQTLFGDRSGELFYQASGSHMGHRWALNNSGIYDFNTRLLGNLTLPDYWYSFRTVLSRDGRRAYIIAFKDGAISLNYNPPSESTTADRPRVFVYNTNTLTAPRTEYPLLGYFELQDYAGCRSFHMDTCSPVMEMTLSHDDRTLFFVGAKRFIVAPIPSQYLPATDPGLSASAAVSVHSRQVASPNDVLKEMTFWRRRH